MTVKIEYRTERRYAVTKDGAPVGEMTCLGFTDWTVRVGQRCEGAGSYAEAAQLAADLAEAPSGGAR